MRERIYGDKFPILSYVTRKCSARADWNNVLLIRRSKVIVNIRVRKELIARFRFYSRVERYILERKEIKTTRQLVDCIIDCYPERNTFFFLAAATFLIIQRCAFRLVNPPVDQYSVS